MNGNLTSDLNKAISSITYNHLNLSHVVTITGKDSITYTYSAAGYKLRKETIDNTVNPSKTTTTTYIGSAVYENDVLQFVADGEGRIRFKSCDSSFQYDYMLKDHLGNVRMVLTTQKQTDAYPVASLETTSLANEKLYYSGLDTGRVNKNTVSGYPSDTYTNPNDFYTKAEWQWR